MLRTVAAPPVTGPSNGGAMMRSVSHGRAWRLVPWGKAAPLFDIRISAPPAAVTANGARTKCD